MATSLSRPNELGRSRRAPVRRACSRSNTSSTATTRNGWAVSASCDADRVPERRAHRCRASPSGEHRSIDQGDREPLRVRERREPEKAVHAASRNQSAGVQAAVQICRREPFTSRIVGLPSRQRTRAVRHRRHRAGERLLQGARRPAVSTQSATACGTWRSTWFGRCAWRCGPWLNARPLRTRRGLLAQAPGRPARRRRRGLGAALTPAYSGNAVL